MVGNRPKLQPKAAWAVDQAAWAVDYFSNQPWETAKTLQIDRE